MLTTDILIIGSGATGTLVAANLLRAASVPMHVTLLGDAPAPGRGVAYGTDCSSHLLNVPAAGMSAWPDRPSHFLEWARAQVPGVDRFSFLSRPLYARYLADVLDRSIDIGRTAGATLEHVRGRAVGARPVERDGVAEVQMSDGRMLRARRVVLALGNFPPAPVPNLTADVLAHDRYVNDPWKPGALDGAQGEDPILLVGTGLTMYDVFLGLRRDAPGPSCIALSRNGLRPEVHVLRDGPPPSPAFDRRSTLNDIAQALEVAADGAQDWRAKLDSVRPLTPGLWVSLSIEERRRFLKQWRRQWDVRRHRAAPDVDAFLRAHERAGTLEISAGEIIGARVGPGALLVTERGPSATRELKVSRIVNCTGPDSDYARIDDPLVKDLRNRGVLRPCPLGLGVETGTDCSLIGRSGDGSTVFYAAGPPTKPMLWEITAIPEIREQATALAIRLIEGLTPAQVPALV